MRTRNNSLDYEDREKNKATEAKRQAVHPLEVLRGRESSKDAAAANHSHFQWGETHPFARSSPAKTQVCYITFHRMDFQKIGLSLLVFYSQANVEPVAAAGYDQISPVERRRGRRRAKNIRNVDAVRQEQQQSIAISVSATSHTASTRTPSSLLLRSPAGPGRCGTSSRPFASSRLVAGQSVSAARRGRDEQPLVVR